jgi:hypothetical protein
MSSSSSLNSNSSSSFISSDIALPPALDHIIVEIKSI